MKKLFSFGLALSVVAGFALNGHATLTNSNTASQHGNQSIFAALITATGNDTTANADSNVISNLDGSIKNICAGVKATNQTGTSPTLTVSFLGSHDGTVFHALTTAQADTAGTAGAMASPALSISSASSTNVGTGICTSQFGVQDLPPYIKVRVAVGGSSTPGWTGVAYAAVKRAK